MKKNLVVMVSKEEIRGIDVFPINEKVMLVTLKGIPSIGLLVSPTSGLGHRWAVTFKGADEIPFLLRCVGDCCIKKYLKESDFTKIDTLCGEQRIKVLYARNANGMKGKIDVPVYEGNDRSIMILPLVGIKLPFKLFDAQGKAAPCFHE